MRRTQKRSNLAILFVAAAVAVPIVTADVGTADADVTVRVRGKVKVRVEGNRTKRVRVRHRQRQRRTPPPRVRLRIGGGIHWHGSAQIGGFAEPPPPLVHDCDPPPVYAPPLPPPPRVYVHRVDRRPVVIHRRAQPEQLPRFGLGMFAGSISVDDRVSGEDLGLFGRLRLTDKVLLEAEMAKAQMADARSDRRMGGALLYDLRPRSRWSAHVLAGAGITQVDVQDGMWQSKQEYGELGAGLSLRLSKRLHLSADLRAGARTRVEDAPTDQALKRIAPSADDEEQYTRGRLSAVLYF